MGEARRVYDRTPILSFDTRWEKKGRRISYTKLVLFIALFGGRFFFVLLHHESPPLPSGSPFTLKMSTLLFRSHVFNTRSELV